MTTGSLNALQAKSIIIADGGYEGVWNGSAIGLGVDLAMRTGLAIRDLEFVSWTPLAIDGTNVVLPIGMLADGATLHHANGDHLDVDDFADAAAIANAMGNESIVLDARNMGSSSVWWAQTAELLSTRLGINMSKQTIPVTAQVSTTLGGITTDEHGRAISGKWSRWFTGLYAAGESASSGVHGAGMVAGNRLLDALSGGAAAGEHAAKHASDASYTGRSKLETFLGVAEADLDFEMASSEEGPVQRSGALFAKLSEIMNSKSGASRDESGLLQAIQELEGLSIDAEKLHLDDSSRLFNTNLLDSLRLKAGVRLAKATVQSAISRTESRGSHQRSDFEESDSEQIHHTLVDIDGNTSTLAIRKGSGRSWTLSPGA